MYKVGDKVRIVSERVGDRWSPHGKMEKRLGEIMTIKAISDDQWYKMEEDKDERDGLGWNWYPEMIEGLVEEKTLKYKVGDRVRIVSERVGNDWAPKGKMDKWLGKTMTIRALEDICYRMEEDKDFEYEGDSGRGWYPEMIEGLVEEKALKYKVGDKVRIVSERVGDDWTPGGSMDKWLGKIMTIRIIKDTYYRMEEDKDLYYAAGFGRRWYPEMIEGLVEEKAPNHKELSDSPHWEETKLDILITEIVNNSKSDEIINRMETIIKLKTQIEKHKEQILFLLNNK